MALAVANVWQDFGAGGGISNTIPYAQSAGDAIVICCYVGGTSNPITGVTDSKSNTYTRARTASQRNVLEYWYCANVVAAAINANTLTVACSGGAIAVAVCRVTGGGGALSYTTGSDLSNAGSSTTVTAPAISPAGSNSVVFAYATSLFASYSAVGTGYTSVGTNPDNYGGMCEYKILASTSAVTPSFTMSGSGFNDISAVIFDGPGAAASDIIPMIGGGRRVIDLPHYRMRDDEDGARTYLRRQRAANERGQLWA